MKKKLIILFAALAVFLAAAGYLYSLRITKVRIIGSDRYTSEQLMEYLFPEKNDQRWCVLKYKQLTGKLKKVSIPFVENYDIEIVSKNEVEVVLYEKEIIAYMTMMETNFYLDNQGYVVETTKEVYTGIPRIAGLSFDSAVINKPLPVEDKTVFKTVLLLANELQKKSLAVDLIRFSNDKTIMLFMDHSNIKVRFGDESNISGKVNKLSEIYEKIIGKKGTLYLDSFSLENKDKDIIFRLDEEEAQG